MLLKTNSWLIKPWLLTCDWFSSLNCLWGASAALGSSGSMCRGERTRGQLCLAQQKKDIFPYNKPKHRVITLCLVDAISFWKVCAGNRVTLSSWHVACGKYRTSCPLLAAFLTHSRVALSWKGCGVWSESSCSGCTPETCVVQHLRARHSRVWLLTPFSPESIAHLTPGLVPLFLEYGGNKDLQLHWLVTNKTLFHASDKSKPLRGKVVQCSGGRGWVDGVGAFHGASRGRGGGNSAPLQGFSPALAQQLRSCCLLQAGSWISKPGWGLHVEGGTKIPLKWGWN